MGVWPRVHYAEELRVQDDVLEWFDFCQYASGREMLHDLQFTC
jgi:hypothetical protein